jgi:hypothetical protein
MTNTPDLKVLWKRELLHKPEIESKRLRTFYDALQSKEGPYAEAYQEAMSVLAKQVAAPELYEAVKLALRNAANVETKFFIPRKSKAVQP